MPRTEASVGLWIAYTVFVVYGSLVPLDYRPVPLDQALHAFRNIPFLKLGLESRADWVSNGTLYLPLGYLTATALLRSLGCALRLPALLLACVFCAALAVGVEFTQLFFPPRTVSLNDLLAEGIGSVLGVALSPFLLPWLKRFLARWDLGGRDLGVHLLEVYAVAYLLLCMFPYDLLLSVPELRGKVESSSWGWWLSAANPRPTLVALHLGVEIVMAMPYGLLMARRRNQANTGLARAAMLGLVLGLGIEAGQFLIASGISQGVSVLSRIAGVMLGVVAWRARDRLGLEQLSGLLRRHVFALGLAYAVILAAVNGWFLFRWQGLDAAAAQWTAVRLMPFYYHYYTTEAQALFSLGSVALIYLPVAALGWAFRWSTTTTAAFAAATCLMVEIGKLFLVGAHPDPTNLLIAAAVCVLALRTVALANRRQAHAPDVSDMPPTPVSAPTVTANSTGDRQRHSLIAALALLCLATAGISASLFPAFPALLIVLLGACAAVVWFRPVLALAIIPAALPVLDLAPWSGRFYWDEFDLLMLACVAVGVYRSMPIDRRGKAWTALTASFALLALSLILSTTRALLPWQWPEANSFANYYSPYNALRIAKGTLWAWAYVWLYRRLAPTGAERGRMFALGINIGLALTVAFIVWERAAFVGLFDFASDYRVTGPISAMHKGGAYIECFLAVASAFAGMSVLQARTWVARLPAALLLLGATYGLAVTFSRNGYAAFGLLAVVVLGAGWMPAKDRRRRAVVALLLAGLVSAVAVPIVVGPYARDRLAHMGRDLVARQAHWVDALQLRDPGWATELFGMGIGRFPESHFWRSKEATHAGTYRLEQDAGNPFLRLGAGASIYLEQIVDLAPGKDYVLSARVRSNRPSGAVGVALCQKWMLTSAHCESAALASRVAGIWQRAEVRLKTSTLTDQPWFAHRPLKLALVSPSQTLRVDVDEVRLEAASNANVLANGDFSAGLDHWFFTTDVDPPWHIHSLPIAIVFDQGWLGAAAWAALLCVALGKGAAKAYRGSAPALAALAAVLGFLVSGSLNTLIDAPRFLWLFLVLIWLCGAVDSQEEAARPG